LIIVPIVVVLSGNRISSALWVGGGGDEGEVGDVQLDEKKTHRRPLALR
jgi:hypothetical protein